jgi:type I restriction enzyme S subunit
MSSWPIVALEDVFAVARGGSPRPIDSFITDDPNGVNWIMIGDASEGSKYISSTKKRIIKEGVKKSRMVSAGDFLLTNSMSFGKPYILKTSGCIHDGWLVLSPRHDQIYSDFFYYLLGSELVYSDFKKLAAGAVVKNLNSELVRGVQIPLPPLEEQKRIAAILDAADSLRAKRRQSIAQLDALIQSTFLDLFGDPVTNPMGWPTEQIGNLGNVVTGKTPPSKENGMFGYDIPFATPSDLDHQLEYTDRSITHAGAKFSKVVREGSTLVCCIGTLGKMARTPQQTAFNQQINAVEWRREINDWFGLFALGFCKKQMVANSSATTLPILNKSGFSKVEMLKPPLPLQQKFAAIVESIERQKTTQRAHLAELDALFASLQHRAFRGEL